MMSRKKGGMYAGLMLMETCYVQPKTVKSTILKIQNKRLTIRCKQMGYYASMYLVGILNWSFISSVVMVL